MPSEAKIHGRKDRHLLQCRALFERKPLSAYVQTMDHAQKRGASLGEGEYILHSLSNSCVTGSGYSGVSGKSFSDSLNGKDLSLRNLSQALGCATTGTTR